MASNTAPSTEPMEDTTSDVILMEDQGGSPENSTAGSWDHSYCGLHASDISPSVHRNGIGKLYYFQILAHMVNVSFGQFLKNVRHHYLVRVDSFYM